MVTAAGLVELIGPWATGADPLNEQLADALTRAIEIDLLPTGHAPPRRTRAGQGAGTQPNHDRRRV